MDVIVYSFIVSAITERSKYIKGEAYRKDNFCYYMYYAFGVTLISFKYVGKE